MNEIPNIKLNDGQLEGTINLPIWKTFQCRRGPYGSHNSNESSDGIFAVSIGGDMVTNIPSISLEHVNAYNYLTSHSEQVHKSILTRLLSSYKNLQADYGYDDEKAKEIMPDIDSIDQFKNLLGLSQIHLMNVSKDGFAYVGYQLGCTWDDEHGLGFMTHKDRIIDFGGADTSFLTWVAENDLK